MLVAVAAAAATAQQPARDIDVDDVRVPDGYRIEAVVANLSVPTTAIFDGADLLIAESGHKNTAKPRVLRVRPDGTVHVIASEGLLGPVTGLAVRNGQIYVSHRTKVSIVEGSALRDIVTNLPSEGDHQNNQIVFGPDGKIYMGQGTTTNTGVVGIDNHIFGWLERHPGLHEIPCQDIVLTGENFKTPNPLTPNDDEVTTGAYRPFGAAGVAGEVIKGSPKCGGSIARFNPDGSGFELVASGLRNPFGLAFDGNKQLWSTFHGADVRGSRNVFNDPDYLVRVEHGAWYGWPEFFDGEPVTASRFNAIDKPKPTFLWKEHPVLTPAFATISSHAAASGLAFSPGGAFGYPGDVFIAQFGTFAPVTTGINVQPLGFRVVRLDMRTRESHDFARNQLPGPAYLNGQEGFNRPVDVVFGPDSSLYVVDWGASTINDTGLILYPGTGVVWRIYREGQQAAVRPTGPVVVTAAGVPEDQREPEVPNIPESYRSVASTLALLIGSVIATLFLIIYGWRRARRK
ncbi:MAG: PQQ-dependent sugar dehydrogenase [Vicinamibacterales bacterium]